MTTAWVRNDDRVILGADPFGQWFFWGSISARFIVRECADNISTCTLLGLPGRGAGARLNGTSC